MDSQPEEKKTEEISEAKRKKMIEETVQKWLLLQKTVKEEITLEDIIRKQQENDTNKLREYIRDYYDLKIKSRKIYEDIRNLKTYEEKKKYKNENEKQDIKEFYIENEEDKVLTDACEPIKNLLFLFRNNYDYITKLISLIDYQDEKEQIESLVELLCNQFYNNILIPNPEQEELLILIYKLLEEEITPMNSASIDEFMHDSTFLGKFISSFMKRQELNVFLATLLNPMIGSIENEKDGCLDMSLFSIQNYIKKEREKEERDKKKEEKGKTFPKSKTLEIKGMNEIVNEQLLFKNIPKTKIHFKKNLQIEAEKAEENRRANFSIETEGESMETSIESGNDLKLVQTESTNSKNEDDNIEYNEEYNEILSQEKLTLKFKNSKENKDLRDFYEHQLEQINNDPNIFSNTGLTDVLNEDCFSNEKTQIMTIYKNNFLFIQKKVDTIIQSLIDKITSIPYTVRCISKIISLLISKKFPLLPKYLQNSFIGKFIFNKCIFPVLSLENKNVVENIIFNLDTKKCLNVIISVLSTANKCILYNCNTDTEKTIFNYYLMEIIPILNQFYEKLIDIELPKTLNDLVSKTKDRMEENTDSQIFSFRRKQNNPNNKAKAQYSATPLYDYFSENSDEIMQIQSICFSLSDIFFIKNLIDKDRNKFKDLPRYDSFIKALNIITSNEHKLDQQLVQEKTRRRFFVIYKIEKNAQLEKIFRQKNKIIKENSAQESELIRFKIKDCIKKILRGLNVLNNKDYSYLNMATSNEKFLLAIQYTLEDILEFSENENEIPLHWYGQFIANNKQSLDRAYLDNDLEKLYEELYNEETNMLNELKSYSSIIITRDGMNLRCAEKILEKTRNDQRRIIKAKKLQKVENFIDKDQTTICIKIKEEDKNKGDKEKGGIKGLFGKKEGKSEPFAYISIVDVEKCPHKNIAFMASIEGEKKVKINTHARSINDFINKFRYTKKDEPNKNEKEKKDDLKILNRFIREDIETGDAKYQVFKAFNEYLELLKESIKKKKIYIESTNEKEREKELTEFTNQIEEHIMRKIYKYVYPQKPLKKDNEFYKKTILLDWVTPENLEIKKLFINQLGLAILCIKKMDEAKSVIEKIKCIQNAQTSVNNLYKFSTGKNKDAGQDETTPIFQYIIIKAHPKRMISNLNYIKTFFDMVNGGQNSFLVTQLESFITFVENVTYQQLKISAEEFKKNIREAEKKFELKEKNKK